MPISSSTELAPLPPTTTIDAIVVAARLLPPWDAPQYNLALAHLESCAILLQKAAVAFWEAPQSSAQDEHLEEVEA